MASFYRLLCQILLTSVVFFISSQLWAESPHISYDKTTDTISVAANEASYKAIMARIATLSGVEILMDPKAEHNITIDVSDLPLEKALKQLSRQTSFVLIHDIPETDVSKSREKPVQPILVRMRILPEGEFTTDALYPILAPAGEAFIREKNRYSAPAQQVDIFNHAQKRWEARLKAMSSEKREKLLEIAQEKRKQMAQNRAEQEQRKKALAEKREAYKKRRDVRLEELKLTDPERYELRMKRRAERQLGVNSE
ncbi:MAG: hypothetical protein L3J98_06940 [Gammaproteobacteria bacterium]|nr:hypothetical protein [Gammaproteobacteria bacterium]MCF6259883.1 hypothetical protein [Gammaproteobacteria bacterium]